MSFPQLNPKKRHWKNNYNQVITKYNFRSHCSCDLEFFRCLKNVGSNIAESVGLLYFNILKTQCLLDDPTSPSLSSGYSVPLGAEGESSYSRLVICDAVI